MFNKYNHSCRCKYCGLQVIEGFNPELNKSALKSKKQTAGAKMAFSQSKTCEIGLSEESGLDYNSIFLPNKQSNKS